MNILLSIIYGTSFGEELVLNLITGTKDGIRQSTPYRMRTINGREWMCDLRLDLRTGTYIDYFYSVVRGEDNVVRREWTMEPHRLEINAVRGKSITVYDHWIDPVPLPHLRPVFSNSVFAQSADVSPSTSMEFWPATSLPLTTLSLNFRTACDALSREVPSCHAGSRNTVAPPRSALATFRYP